MPLNERQRRVCLALCRSRKFETGQGGCAPICMSMLGDARAGPHGCSHIGVHGKLADQILAALSD